MIRPISCPAQRAVIYALLVSTATMIFPAATFPQESAGHEEEKHRLGELQRYERWSRLEKMPSEAQDRFDVTYYKLDLQISTAPRYLRGVVTMTARCTADSVGSLVLDLRNTMKVDSVEGGRLVEQQSLTVHIDLDRIYLRSEFFTIRIHYQGLPEVTGFGSFRFIDSSGVPWVWSLSEPYGARDWWPCKDHPSDKADSVDVWVTCDARFKVGSQGVLEEVTPEVGGMRTHKWKHRYPIATYLVSVALTEYEEIVEWYRYAPADSMLVLHYVRPENVHAARPTLSRTIEMLHIFSDLFGEYPFVKEKYGHAQFGWGGGMEHQTMTSLGSFGEYLIAHELAHQWFGDMITMRTWPDIWLNEGFATYSEALYAERKYGWSSYLSRMASRMNNARFAVGSLYVQDTATTSRLFSSALVYSKGATVLHMLRRVLGDSVFFAALKSYATNPNLMYATASTYDLRAVCESVSGKDLGYFFDQWILGTGYPRYKYSWGKRPLSQGYRVRLTIAQSLSESQSTFFRMPIDVRISGGGWDTTLTVFNDVQDQTFEFDVARNPDSLQLDPGNWILKEAVGVVVDIGSGIDEVRDFVVYQNYPNPFNAGTAIPIDVPAPSKVRVEVFNILGQLVTVIEPQNEFTTGRHTILFDGRTREGLLLSSGVYIYRVTVGFGAAQAKAMVLVR